MIHIEINGTQVKINGESLFLECDPDILLGSPGEPASVVMTIVPDVLTIRNSDPEENN